MPTAKQLVKISTSASSSRICEFRSLVPHSVLPVKSEMSGENLKIIFLTRFTLKNILRIKIPAL